MHSLSFEMTSKSLIHTNLHNVFVNAKEEFEYRKRKNITFFIAEQSRLPRNL